VSEADSFAQLALLGEAAACLQDGAVFVWDEDRNYVAVNDAACRLVGLTREELLGMPVGSLSRDGGSPHFEEVQRHAPLAGRSSFEHPDGTEVEIEWVTFHSRLAGLPYMVSVCWRDGRA
jgi:PAS domain S-box-containing protein